MVVAAALTSCALAALPTVPASAATPSLTTVEAGQIKQLLDQVSLGTLSTEELVEALEGLPQLEGIGAGTLRKALTSTIETLQGEGADLGELLESPASAAQLSESLKETLGPLLELLLGSNPAAALTEALGSQSANEVLGSVLQSSDEPEKVISEALSSIPSLEVEKVLGSVPTGGFSKGTVEELAAQAGVTPEKLAEEFGQTSEQLPPTAMALTSALSNSTKLGVVKTVSGVGMALLGGADGLEGGGEGGEGSGGSGSGSGGSGSGGSGSGGSGGGAGSMTVVLQVPPANQAQSGQSASVGHGIRILSRHVHNHKLTVVVSAPSAGTVSLAGKGIRALRRHAAHAQTLTLRTTLTKATATSLERRHHHGRLRISVRVTFQPVTGASSSASTRAAFS